MALPYCDLHEHILRPRLSPIPAIPSRDVEQAMMRHRVNQPQAVAILSALRTDGFTLIQG